MFSIKWLSHGVLSIFLVYAFEVLANDYPLRPQFPTVNHIESETLHRRLDEFTIVDVRSVFEFETVHIRGALHIPVANKMFITRLESQVPLDEPVAFYCNGITCAKSYKAAREAVAVGYRNAYVYDPGILAWAKSFPENTVLLGESPINLKKLISKEQLEEKMLSFAEFKRRAAMPSTVLIDIRDPYQITMASNRSKKLDLPDMPIRTRNIPLRKISRLLRASGLKSRQLLFYDAVGKQVRWLQYHLENGGYSNYGFLKGGVYGVTGIVNK